MRALPALLATLAVVGATAVGADAATPDEDARRAWSTPGPVDSVLVVSVDGLNPTALARLGRSGTPNLHRFVRQGASTLNARTEWEMTVTLPNHTGMVTGRRVEAATGGHGVWWNDERLEPRTVQTAAGHDVSSVFSVVHDAGGSTALFASKTKFSLWDRSWPDAVDLTTLVDANGALVEAARDDLRVASRGLRFVHLSLPDKVGHDHGFMSPRYLDAVRRVDRLVGRLVRTVRRDPVLRAHTAVVLTSDHGGRGDGHYDPTKVFNYRVPFMVQGPGVDAGADLYELNDDYRDPGRRRVGYGAARQPVRNGMVANLALDLLGLGPVPGSEHDVEQDLDVTARPE